MGAARFDPGWLAPASPCGAARRARAAARVAVRSAPRSSRLAVERCSQPHVEVVPGDATLVAFRAAAIRRALVAALAEQGVVVRDIPKTGLVRASSGWWTSEDDLQRLAAGVEGT